MAKKAEAEPSVDELMALETAEEPSVEDLESLPTEEQAAAPGLIMEALKAIESYTGAPTRAAMLPIAAKGPAGILEAPAAFAAQFGEEPGEAPTMREVAQVAGVSERPMAIPQGEPGLAGPSAEEIQALVSRLTGKPAQVPMQAPASEIAAAGMEQVFDPTAAMALGIGAGLKSAKVGLPVLGQALAGAASGAYKGARALTTAGAEAGGTIAGSLKDLPTGQAAGKFAKAAATEVFKNLEELPETIKQTYEGLKPKIRDKYVDQLMLAERTGVDPALITDNARLMYGADSFVAKKKAADVSMGLTAGGGKAWDELNTQISGALDQQIKKLSNGIGTPDAVETGNKILQGYRQSIGKMFDEAQVRYSNIVDQVPGLKFTEDSQLTLFGKLAQMEQDFKRQAAIAVKKDVAGRAAENLKAIQKIAVNLADGDIKSAIEQMQQVGRELSETPKMLPQGVVDVEYKVLSSLYNDLKDAVMTSVKEADPDVYLELVKSNELQSRFFKANQPIGDIINSSKYAPETIYQKLIASGDSNKLAAVNEILGGTEAIDAIRGQVLYDQLKLNADQLPKFGQMQRALLDPKTKRLINSFFHGDELSDFSDLLQLGRDAGDREFNPSRSGVVMSMIEAAKSPMEYLESVATGKGFVRGLEQAGYRDYFKDMNVSQIIDLKKRGMFDPELIETVIKEKLENPIISKQIREAAQAGTITPDMYQQIKQIHDVSTPATNWSVIRDFLSSSGESIGLGLVPGSSPFERATKVLTMINRMNTEKFGSQSVPVLVPEEERASVREIILGSPMDSITAAKNLKAMERTGYLLDLKGLTGEQMQEPVIKRVMEKTFKSKKQETLKQDRPDVLKAMEEKVSK
jgi:hypothetical protein